VPVVEVAAAVIRRDGKYLICRRRPGDSGAGLWEFPGGKVEPGESLPACAVREIREELGCGIVAGAELESVAVRYGDRELRVHFLAATLVDGEPRPIECDELAWAAPEEFGRYAFLGANGAITARLARDTGPGG